jgi:Raf kinase inhibitor-like YbhB/YbcL family protein
MRRYICPVLVIAGVGGVLAGCGGGSPAGAGVASVTSVSAPTLAVADSEPIVTVAGQPAITKASLEHWVSVIVTFEHASSKSRTHAPMPTPPDYTACVAHRKASTRPATARNPKSECEAEYVKLERKALDFLIASEWTRGEAANLHLAVSHAETKHRLDEVRSKDYPKASQFTALLRSSGETIGDVLWRLEAELLQAKISESAAKGKTQTTEEKIVLSDYQEAFAARWKGRTNCHVGYVVEDCMQFKSPPPVTTPEQKEAHTYTEELREKKEVEKEEAVNSKKLSKHETVSATPRRATSRDSRSNGESFNTLGGMNLTSPAFEGNGQIPVAYTCDGAGISPPMHWARIPSEAKSLLLYVIDDTQDSFTDPTGGIRWMVANINPEETDLTAGRVPAGTVVGKGNDGKADYGPICPEKGKTDSIEFVMYAFKQKLDVKPGFTEQEVQEQYTANGNKVLSENATIDGSYTRP